MKVLTFVCLFFLSLIAKSQHEHPVASPQGPFQIIIFMAVDCPITQKYMGTIKELAQRYSNQQIVVIGYFPAGLSKKGAKQFRQEYLVPEIIRFVDDNKHVAMKKYGATITPEAVLVDRNQHVIYQGAIDNWFFELGRYRLEITEYYLIDAIEASLMGKEPSVKKTEAIGCFIQGATVDKKEHHQH